MAVGLVAAAAWGGCGPQGAADLGSQAEALSQGARVAPRAPLMPRVDQRAAPGIKASTKAKLVGMDMVNAVVMNNAEALWGEVYPDEPIPLYDLEDQPSGYMFNFRVGAPFPEDGEVLATLAPDDPWGTAEYRHIATSATYDQQPLDEVAADLSQEYVWGPETEDMARELLEGRQLELERIYDLGLAVKWYVYTDGERRAFVRILPPRAVYTQDEFDQKVRKPRLEELAEAWKIYEPYAKEDEFVSDYTDDWEAQAAGDGLLAEAEDERGAAAGSRGGWSYNYIQHYDLVPYFDWHYGCTPTAAAMVLGYYDKIGILPGGRSFSRLIQKYESLWDGVENETDHHVPDVNGVLASRMHTDSGGGTSWYDISDGVDKAVGDRGYESHSKGHGTLYADVTYLDDLMDEIRHDRPCLFHSTGHSNTAVGYMRKRVTGGVKHKALVHNTYDAVVHTHSCKYCYKVTSIHMHDPAEEDVGTIELSKPLGNTNYDNNPAYAVTLQAGQSYWIKWDSDFVNYGTVDITLYGQGGGPTLLASVPNTHSWLWTIPEGSQNMAGMRIQVQAHSPGGYLIGADASSGYFDIEGVLPDLIIDSADLLGPPNPDPAGDVYNLQMVVKNIGPGTAAPFDVNVLITNPNQVTTHPIPGLVSGQAMMFHRGPTLALGQKYQVIILADATSVVPESDEGNNTRSLYLGSDLELVSITHTPSYIRVGHLIQFNGLVRNNGNMWSPATEVHAKFADQSTTTVISVPGLAPGGSYSFHVMRTFSSAGMYSLTMTADGAHTDDEIYENNNIRTVLGTVSLF